MSRSRLSMARRESTETWQRVVAGRRRMPGERIAPAPERAGADRRWRFLSPKLEVKTNIHGKGRTI